MLQTILIFLAVLGALVAAHELGHFVVAKLAGIRVQEFGFGFPPRVAGYRRGETLYSVNLLPLGGFVKMVGENGGSTDPRAFSSKSLGVRARVLMAGSAMNLALAPLLFAVALMVGEPVPCETCPATVVYSVAPGGPADAAGIREGDVLLTVSDQAVRTSEDVRRVAEASTALDLKLELKRADQTLTVQLVPRTPTQKHEGAIGIQLGAEYVMVRRAPLEALQRGAGRVGELLQTLPATLGRLFSGDVGAELTGPVGIARGTARAAQAGPNYLLAFSAFLSLNLAVVNMLPLPGLDGGRLLFVAIEAVRRGRRVDPRLEGRLHLAGMGVLLAFMAYASVHDVRGILAGG